MPEGAQHQTANKIHQDKSRERVEEKNCLYYTLNDIFFRFLNKQLHSFISHLHSQIMEPSLPSSYCARHTIGSQCIPSVVGECNFHERDCHCQCGQFHLSNSEKLLYISASRRMCPFKYKVRRVTVASVTFLADLKT